MVDVLMEEAESGQKARTSLLCQSENRHVAASRQTFAGGRRRPEPESAQTRKLDFLVTDSLEQGRRTEQIKTNTVQLYR